MNRVLENLYLDLNDAIPYCLRCLADYYEEQGNIRMRNAWLYIARERFEPRKQWKTGYCWFLESRGDFEFIPFEMIPRTIDKYYKGDTDHGKVYFNTLAEAYQWLVELVVQWQDNEK